MNMEDQKVLCLPRSSVDDLVRFTPWASADQLFRSAKEEMRWLPRGEAEASDEFIQPIPCALVLGSDKGYYVFRHVSEGRPDLRARLSLIVGGHIDWDGDTSEFLKLVEETLTREIQEELDAEQIGPAKPVGVVVDHASIEASRHVGFVHEVIVTGSVRPTAREEFALSSSYAGRLCAITDLSERLSERYGDLDPWSSIIFGDYIAPEYALDVGRQRQLL